MRHSIASRHQVDLAGLEHHIIAKAVLVADVSSQRQRHRLQAGVRVRQHLHRAAGGSEAVHETPCAYRRRCAVRERAIDLNAAKTAERHLAARHQKIGPRRVARNGLRIRHAMSRCLPEVSESRVDPVIGNSTETGGRFETLLYEKDVL